MPPGGLDPGRTTRSSSGSLAGPPAGPAGPAGSGVVCPDAADLRTGDRNRGTRNEVRSGLVDVAAAKAAAAKSAAAFGLEGGRSLDMRADDPRPRRVDPARAYAVTTLLGCRARGDGRRPSARITWKTSHVEIARAGATPSRRPTPARGRPDVAAGERIAALTPERTAGRARERDGRAPEPEKIREAPETAFRPKR